MCISSCVYHQLDKLSTYMSIYHSIYILMYILKLCISSTWQVEYVQSIYHSMYIRMYILKLCISSTWQVEYVQSIYHSMYIRMYILKLCISSTWQVEYVHEYTPLHIYTHVNTIVYIINLTTWVCRWVYTWSGILNKRERDILIQREGGRAPETAGARAHAP